MTTGSEVQDGLCRKVELSGPTEAFMGAYAVRMRKRELFDFIIARAPCASKDRQCFKRVTVHGVIFVSLLQKLKWIGRKRRRQADVYRECATLAVTKRIF